MRNLKYALLFSVALIAVTTVACMAAQPLKYSTWNGSQQIWIPADAFVARSMNALDANDQPSGLPDFVSDPNVPAANTLTGTAYNIPGNKAPGSSSYPPATQMDWWVEYSIPLSALPGGFIQAGSTWGFYARTSSSATAASSVDSDWLLVAGDPGDNVNTADWKSAINPAYTVNGQPAQRVLNNVMLDGGLLAYNFGWFSEGYGIGNVVSQKVFNPIGGSITFRIYEREADPFNALIDVICFTTDVSGVLPTDDQYLRADVVPEPGTFLVLALGGAQVLALIRRRAS